MREGALPGSKDQWETFRSAEYIARSHPSDRTDSRQLAGHLRRSDRRQPEDMPCGSDRTPTDWLPKLSSHHQRRERYSAAATGNTAGCHLHDAQGLG